MDNGDLYSTELYNEDELNPPEWLNREFLQQVLQNAEGKEVEVAEFVITPGTTKRDHYASIMFRVMVNYTIASADRVAEQQQKQHRSFIIKTMPEKEGHKKDVLSGSTFFETEIKMYAESLPKMEAILRSTGDETKLCASLVYHSLEPRKCLVFEDLVERGYTSVSSRCCTKEEVQRVLMKVAKIHATSYKLDQEGDISMSAYKNKTYAPETFDKFEMMKNGIHLFKEIISQHEDLLSYVPHLEKIEQNLNSQIFKYFNSKKQKETSAILVLNHGDVHTKNLLIRLDDSGKLHDLMLLDYQISTYGSLAIDLLYACVMLFSPEMRLHQREELYYYYFRTFQQTLEQLDFAGHIPTMLEFQVEILKHKPWELFLLTAFLAMGYLLREADGDIGRYCEDIDYRRQTFQKPELMQEIRNMLPRLLHEGYFEDL